MELVGQCADTILHDLLLERSVGLDVHGRHGGAGLVVVLDVREAKRTATVHVLLEFRDGSSGVLLGAELDNTGAAGATVGLVLDLSALNLTDSSEELDEVLVASAPRKVADVDHRRRVHARSGIVGERVRGSNRSDRGDSAVASSARRRASVATRRAVRTRTAVATTGKATAKSTTASETSRRAVAATPTESTIEASTTVAAGKATTTTEAAAATEATSASKAVLTNFENATRPVVAVELLNGVLGVLGSLESDDTRALGSAIWGGVHVGADDGTALTEEVFQVLPANVVGKL
jgi:hypothetical protein